MSSTTKKLLLIDGMVLIYRSHYAFSAHRLLTSTGKDLSIALGFTNTLLGILEREKPTHIAVAFDTPAPTKRHSEFPAYKEKRQRPPEILLQSIPDIHRILKAFNIPTFSLDGYEADDLIGTIAKKASENNFKVFIATIDKDFAQLVSDRIFLYKYKVSAKGDKNAEIIGVPEVREKWGIDRPVQFIDLIALAGDAADNIPGVEGIGEKRAKSLVARFGDTENLIENAWQLKGKLGDKISQNRDKIELSKRLATIICDVPIAVELESLRSKTPNLEELKSLLIEFEFGQIGKRIFGKSFRLDRAKAKSKSLKSLADVDHDYRLSDTPEKRSELIELLKTQPAFCFDCETTGLDTKRADLVGIAFSFEAHSGFYVPFPEDRAEAKIQLEEFRPLFTDKNIEKVGHNLKFDLSILWWHGISIEGKFFDTIIAHRLLEPELRHGMDALAERYLGYSPLSYKELTNSGETNIRDLPIQTLAGYAVEDADITWQLRELFQKSIETKKLAKVLYEVELPLLPALVSIEANGIRVDRKALKNYSAKLSTEIIALTTEIYDIAGTTFNVDSPKQLGTILFDRLKLVEKPKKTKGGAYSTSAQILEKLAPKHEIVRKILDFRVRRKLKSTYVDALPKAIFDGTQRIHSTFDQNVTATGRIQSRNPNLQNIPMRTKLGREMRRAFVPASEDYLLFSADYSQIELRIIASLSGDEGLIEAFLSGADVHSETAKRVFGIPIDEVTDEFRHRAKMVNYGLAYGLSAFGLAQRLNIPRGEAQSIIDNYFRQYPRIKEYMSETIEFARKNGYVATVMGRRRSLPTINSRNKNEAKAAERHAFNAVIQGSSADMVKVAMSKIYHYLSIGNFKTKMILQVHDELLFDLHKSEKDILMPRIVEFMTNAIPMKVPIEVETGIGENWLEAH